uniref:F-box and leucine rich repeat protein n=1 Tax=Oncorhynchus kisutch TaxID=8019 RepID=A0A8C7GKG9_ONCKI
MVLPELRTLDLSECLHVSGAEIVKGLSAPEPRARLETLSLKSCTYIRPRLVTDKALGVFREQEGASLLVLRSLQDLDLSACSKLTDSSITQHVLRYPDLQRLSLSILPEISDDSLASVAYHCRSLTSLEFSHCPRISDQGIARAAPYLARLQHLYLSYCNALTDRLRTLDISMCKYISLTMVELLQSQLPFIENVHCRFVGGADLTYSDFFLSPAA